MERGLANLTLEDAHNSAYSFCLVGCFLTASVVHFPAMRNTLANIWNPLEGCRRMRILCLFLWFTQIGGFRFMIFHQAFLGNLLQCNLEIS
ncbi:hypothetical protein V6Z11_A03G158000 [Gossypium hirsutum]